MKAEEVKPKEEKIEKPIPQKFYQLFFKTEYNDLWNPVSNPLDGEHSKENLERIVNNWGGKNTEFKLISYEI